MERPTIRQLDIAMDVLRWLHESRVGDGRLRDEISHVRHEIDRVIEEAE